MPNFRLVILLGCIILFQACKLSDLRTSDINLNSPDREEKAIHLIEKAIEAQNFEALSNASTYSYQATDNWKGLMALFNPLPKDNEIMSMRFRPGSFDSQFNYIGDDTFYGVQSFNYYRKKKGN